MTKEKKHVVLTDKGVKNAVPGAERIEQVDAGLPGFYLIIHPSGRKSFAFRYRTVNGSFKKWTIGYYPAMTLAEAHRLAREAIGDIARGGDPAAKKAASRAPEAGASTSDVPKTMGELIEKFISARPAAKGRPALRETTWAAYERYFRNDVLPAWRGRDIASITAVDVEARLEAVAKDRPILANRMASVLSKLFKWAVKKRFLASLPVIEKPSPEKVRERVLSRSELKLVLDAADKLPRTGKHIIHLLVLTLQRRNEIAHMRWSEVDLTEGILTLTGDRTKNRQGHRLPLGDDAMAILKDRAKDETASPYVFPRGRNPFNSHARLKIAIDKLITEANNGVPIPHWQLHDLRRTGTTFMEELGVSLRVTENILNHAGSLDRTAKAYHKHKFENEMREAFAKWEQRIAVIREGNVVVEFPRRSAQ